jgi:hypothetical protein
VLPELTRGASAVRGARISDGHLWFAVDACLYALPLAHIENGGQCPLYDRYRCGTATVSAITSDSGVVYAGDISGRIMAFDAGEPDSQRVIRHSTGQPIESLHVVDTCGVSRLIVADRSRGVCAMVLGDQYTRRYESGAAIVRRAAAAPDLLIGMSDARDRLLAWDPRRADEPTASLVIPHLTGTTIQDVCLI